MLNRRNFIAASATSVAVTVTSKCALAETRPNTLATQESEPGKLDPKLVKSFVGQSHGNLKGVKELVAKEPTLVHASWDWVSGDFETGLGAASHVGNRDIGKFLLDHGARIDAFAMAMLGQVDLIKAIVKVYPNTLSVKGPHGIPLISHAIFGKSSEVFECLLGAKADVNQASNAGQTPLMAAAQIGNADFVKLLLDAKADPNLKNKKQKTALDLAIKRKHEKAIKLLEPVTNQ